MASGLRLVALASLKYRAKPDHPNPAARRVASVRACVTGFRPSTRRTWATSPRSHRPLLYSSGHTTYARAPREGLKVLTVFMVLPLMVVCLLQRAQGNALR